MTALTEFPRCSNEATCVLLLKKLGNMVGNVWGAVNRFPRGEIGDFQGLDPLIGEQRPRKKPCKSMTYMALIMVMWCPGEAPFANVHAGFR